MMNIIEAILRGKRIRRPGWLDMIEYAPVNSMHRYTFNKEDLIADDWEIELEPKKMVKMWQWVVRQNRQERINLTGEFFTSEEAMHNAYNDYYKVIQKAPWTEIEVEGGEG